MKDADRPLKSRGRGSVTAAYGLMYSSYLIFFYLFMLFTDIDCSRRGPGIHCPSMSFFFTFSLFNEIINTTLPHQFSTLVPFALFYFIISFLWRNRNLILWFIYLKSKKYYTNWKCFLSIHLQWVILKVNMNVFRIFFNLL